MSAVLWRVWNRENKGFGGQPDSLILLKGLDHFAEGCGVEGQCFQPSEETKHAHAPYTEKRSSNCCERAT